MLLLKKEYRMSLLLILVFGVFLFFIDQTSAQIISQYTGEQFRYEKPAFLKLIYLVIGAVSLVLLLTLDRSEYATDKEKGNAYSSFILITTTAFFPGWIVHLVFVIYTIQNQLSFIEMEHQFWWYNCSDFTLVIGFSIAGLLKLRPVINDLNKK